MIQAKITVKHLDKILSTININSEGDNIDSIIFRCIIACKDIIRKYEKLDINIKMEYKR